MSAIVPGHRWDHGQNEKNIEALMSDLATQLSFSRLSVFIALEGKHEFLQNTFAAIEGSKIFPH